MKPYRVLHEEDSHFEVDAGDGKPFKVAKPRLSHGTVERIRKFAKGGEVDAGPETGGETPSPEEIQQARFAAEDARSKALLGGAADPRSLGDIASSALQSIQDPAYVARQTGAAATPTTASGVPDLIARPEGALPDGTTPPVVPAYAATAQPPTASPLAGVGAPGDLAAGAKQEQAGIQQRAQAQQGEAAASAGVLDKLARDREAMTVKFEADRQADQAKSDALFNDIQSGKIDPNHFWNTRSTGQKISAAIGLILGGIGAGLTKGPNYAMQVIDKSIDRDMESQKLEMGKKENLLSHYMQQGRDMIAAHSMAKADLLDVASAQLQKVAATYSGQKAAADATIASGQLRQNAAMLRQQATEHSINIASGKLNLQASQYQTQALQELMKGVKGGGGFDARVLELPAFKEYRERAVHLPDGTIAFAADKEEANKARESMATVARLKPKLQRYMDMLNSGSPETIDRGTAQEMHADLLSEMGHLHDLNRLTDVDLHLFEKQVPDISRWLSMKSLDRQKLRGVGKSLDDKVWSVNSAILNRPGRRPGG